MARTGTSSVAFSALGWFFAAVVFAIGLVNVFWGNDPEFGVFLVLLSAVFLPVTNVILDDFTGFTIPGVAKVALGIFILWAALGVGELPDKIDLMLNDI